MVTYRPFKHVKQIQSFLAEPFAPKLLIFCCQDLRGDAKLVREAVGQEPMALEFATAQLQSQRDLVLAAVVAHGHALQFASDELKEDTGTVAVARKDLGD